MREVEKRERRWRWGRWVSMVSGVVLLITGFDLLRLGGVDGQALLLGTTDAAAAYRAFQDATMAVLGILVLIAGFATLVFAVSRWRGDPRSKLLISPMNSVRQSQR